MADDKVERHPAGYDSRKRFPDATEVLVGEGGAVYAAEAEGAWWIITDESMLGEYVDEHLGDLVALKRFDDVDAWRQTKADYAGRIIHGEVEALVRDAVPRIGQVAEQRVKERGLERFTERDHLQPWSAEVLRDTARERHDVTVGTASSLDLPEWPRLGQVDITFTGKGPLLVLLELKCRADVNALGPCVWDVAECASALRHGSASAAYLLAATTTAMWDRPARGAQFFADGAWDAETLRREFEDWWRQWEEEGYRPPRRHSPRACSTRSEMASTSTPVRFAPISQASAGRRRSRRTAPGRAAHRWSAVVSGTRRGSGRRRRRRR